jgi:hypothetical protein
LALWKARKGDPLRSPAIRPALVATDLIVMAVTAAEPPTH